MIILISGASHTGKTNLAQKLLERYGYPYLSLDHLKMGLIRAGYTALTPGDDAELTEYLWPITREIIKTAIENEQNLIIEGCYLPFDWAKDFDDKYLPHIIFRCLIMTKDYINTHFEDVSRYAGVIESRDSALEFTKEEFIRENEANLAACEANGCGYILVDNEYDVDLVI